MTVDRTVVDQAAEVIERSLLVEVNGGELEPIWQIYKPEGVALVIRQALMNAGLLVDDQDRAVLDAAEAHKHAYRCRFCGHWHIGGKT